METEETPEPVNEDGVRKKLVEGLLTLHVNPQVWDEVAVIFKVLPSIMVTKAGKVHVELVPPSTILP